MSEPTWEDMEAHVAPSAHGVAASQKDRAVTRRVAIIGGGESFLERTRSLAVDVLNVQKPRDFATAQCSHADVSLVLDYEDRELLAAVLSGLHQTMPIAAVVAVTEAGLLPAAHANDVLGLSGASFRTVALLTDKWAMRQHLNRAGVSPVAASAGRTISDLASFGERNGYPFIVKPVAASGSIAVFRVDGSSRVGEVWRRIEPMRLPAFLMEEYLDGPELSVECFSFHGRHVPLAFTEKLVGENFVEFGHCIPARLEPALQRQVRDLAGAFLDTVGLRDGPSHTEVKLTAKGPRIVEGHNRRGGDRINRMVELVHGVDIEMLTVRWPLGLAAEPLSSPPASGAVAVRFLSAPRGRVREVRGLEEALRHERVLELHVSFPVGTVVPPLRWSLDRAGHVLARGRSPEEAVALCDRLAGGIRFVVDPVEERPVEDAEQTTSLLRELDQAERLGY